MIVQIPATAIGMFWSNSLPPAAGAVALPRSVPEGPRTITFERSVALGVTTTLRVCPASNTSV